MFSLYAMCSVSLPFCFVSSLVDVSDIFYFFSCSGAGERGRRPRRRPGGPV